MLIILNIIIQIVTLINLTLIGGILPLIERKYLSLIQRRVGPKFVGYKGRLQFIADALKMFLKGLFIPKQTNKLFFLIWPIAFLAFIYLLHVNILWGVNIMAVEVELNILFITIIGLILNLCIFFSGFFSKNKYTMISAVRVITLIICSEFVITIFYLSIIHVNNSLNFSLLRALQEEYVMGHALLFMLPISIILILVEVNKSPFDLAEAETELVTGFHTEYGAFFFALFYLGEYFHIFFSSGIFMYIMTGF